MCAAKKWINYGKTVEKNDDRRNEMFISKVRKTRVDTVSNSDIKDYLCVK